MLPEGEVAAAGEADGVKAAGPANHCSDIKNVSTDFLCQEDCIWWWQVGFLERTTYLIFQYLTKNKNKKKEQGNMHLGNHLDQPYFEIFLSCPQVHIYYII